MAGSLKILLIDDDEDEVLLTQSFLRDTSFQLGAAGSQPGVSLDWADSYEAALVKIHSQPYDVFLVDYHLGPRSGLDLLREMAALGVSAPIILMTGFGSYHIDLEAMKLGATDYLAKSEITAPLLERTIRYAIERKRTEAAIRKNAQRAELLASLSHAFAGAGLEYPAVLGPITRLLSESTGDAVVVRLLSEDGKRLERAALHHPNPAKLEALRQAELAGPLRPGEGLVGQVFAEGKARLVLGKDQLAQGDFDLGRASGDINTRSGIVVPLKAHGQDIGTLSVLRYPPREPHGQDDLDFYIDVAGRVALAIENARLYATVVQRARELNALQNATTALLTTLDLEELFTEVLNAAEDAIPAAERSMLHLLTMETSLLHSRGQHNFFDPRIRRIHPSGRSDFPLQAVREQQPVLIYDAELESSQLSTGILRDVGLVRSAVIAPLVLGKQVLGVLSLGSSQPRAFTDGDLRLLVSFGTTTTAAIHNALLHSEVQHMAITDTLTETYNRRGFFELGYREVERARRFLRPLALIFVDLDLFKEINDTFGHGAGDQALHILSERLLSSVREVDIVGRLGGDEFAILLPETDLYTGCSVAERIRVKITEPMSLQASLPEGQVVSVSASLGVANLVPDTPDLKALLERADAAAYRAKHQGRNQVAVG